MRYNYEVDILIGKVLGRDSSCIGKRRYTTIDNAILAESRHNTCPNMDHKVRAYTCGYCGGYHVGRRWHVDDLKTLLTSVLTEDEKECYMELIDNYYK